LAEFPDRQGICHGFEFPWQIWILMRLTTVPISFQCFERDSARRTRGSSFKAFYFPETDYKKYPCTQELIDSEDGEEED